MPLDCIAVVVLIYKFSLLEVLIPTFGQFLFWLVPGRQSRICVLVTSFELIQPSIVQSLLLPNLKSFNGNTLVFAK